MSSALINSYKKPSYDIIIYRINKYIIYKSVCRPTCTTYQIQCNLSKETTLENKKRGRCFLIQVVFKQRLKWLVKPVRRTTVLSRCWVSVTTFLLLKLVFIRGFTEQSYCALQNTTHISVMLTVCSFQVGIGGHLFDPSQHDIALFILSPQRMLLSEFP